MTFPTQPRRDHRLRHVCLEGPESGVYFTEVDLTGKNIIESSRLLAEDLVDPETITVSLTQIGSSQDLIVDGSRVGNRELEVKSGSGTDN